MRRLHVGAGLVAVAALVGGGAVVGSVFDDGGSSPSAFAGVPAQAPLIWEVTAGESFLGIATKLAPSCTTAQKAALASLLAARNNQSNTTSVLRTSWLIAYLPGDVPSCTAPTTTGGTTSTSAPATSTSTSVPAPTSTSTSVAPTTTAPTTTSAPTTTAPPSGSTSTTSVTPTSSSSPSTSTTSPPGNPGTFVENFNDGGTGAPVPFGDSAKWDVIAYTRDLCGTSPTGAGCTGVLPLEADHDTMCSAPPATHHVSTEPDLVFLCGAGDNRHVMTSINGGEYGQIAMQPKTVFDFAAGGIVQWDVSSLATSDRDWWDVWILPEGATQKIICDENYADTPPDPCLLPQNGIHVKFQTWENNGQSTGVDRVGIEVRVYRNGVGTFLNTESYHGLYEFMAPSAARRDTYKLELSPTSVTLCLPQYAKCYADHVTMPALSWTSGTVHFINHSYNPTKDDTFPNGVPAHPSSWHVDNWFISPTRPL